LQHLTKTDMRQRIHEAVQDEAFIESRIAPITEQAAQEWYRAHAEELRIPALHRVSHIFLSRHVPKKPDRTVEMRGIQRELQKGNGLYDCRCQVFRGCTQQKTTVGNLAGSVLHARRRTSWRTWKKHARGCGERPCGNTARLASAACD